MPLRAVVRLVSRHVVAHFFKRRVEQLAVALVNAADVAQVEPHAALLDGFDDVAALEPADIAFAPCAPRRTLRSHLDERVMLARIAVDEIGQRIEREQRMTLEPVRRLERRLAPLAPSDPPSNW